MEQKRLAGRRKFLTVLSALATGGLLFGYKAFSKDTTRGDNSSNAVTSAGSVALKISSKPNARMGINFSGIAYWATEFPFVDVMHQSGEWVSQPRTGRWGTGPELSLDENGWVRELEVGCRATKILCAGEKIDYPSGTYVLLYDGEGEVKLHIPSVGIVRKVGQGRLEIDVNSKNGMLAIDLVTTNPQNHMRNIRVILPGFESVYQDNPWHPDFLSRWSGVACIRLMDMMATNNSMQESWQDRPKPNDATYAKKGVPVELLVDLANRLNADAWFCMPHQANDEYIRQFAMTVESKLKPHLNAWVEYSNEVWNGGFKQHAYAGKKGQAMKSGLNSWEGSFHYNAHRSVAIFKIWQKVFANRKRLVCVIASHAANAWLAKQLLKAPTVSENVDVLAIAPYVSLNVPLNANDKGLSAESVSKWSLDKLFAHLHSVALPDTEKWIEENKKVAEEYGIELVAYEAGQHLVGISGAEKNSDLTKLFMLANQDVRMGEVYTNHLNYWQKAGGGLMCMFSSTQKWSGYGSWGLLQSYKDKPSDSPKFKAVMSWAKARGQKVSY